MANEIDLSVIEQEIMLAILWQHPNAYGVSIRDLIKARAGKEHSFGSIYAVLERLEDKGLLASREGEATATQGGRKKQFFTVSAPGRRALAHSQQTMEKMAKGLDWGGLPA